MKKKALIVGIADYGDPNINLPGCLKDVQNWTDVLQGYCGFNPAMVRLLADSRATKEQILQRLGWLFQDVSPDDQLVFFFAGHGARVRRRDEDTGDLDDFQDETLVAFPATEEGFIYDDELSEIVEKSNLPASAKVTFIFDSCHSGGMLRNISFGEGCSEIGPVPRCLNLPIDLAHRATALPNKGVRKIGHLHKLSRQLDRHLVIASAREDESAWDATMSDNVRHGVFSYYATRHLFAQPKTSYRELIDTITPFISNRFPQHPLLLGNLAREGNPFFE